MLVIMTKDDFLKKYDEQKKQKNMQAKTEYFDYVSSILFRQHKGRQP